MGVVDPGSEVPDPSMLYAASVYKYLFLFEYDLGASFEK
jgi:hypothetical protein